MLHHHGIAEHSVISVRAGSTRRQAHLSQLDRPFKFPIKPEELATLKVDILDLAGTARIACTPDVSEYQVPLDSPVEGDPSTGMEVSVRITPANGTASGAYPAPAADPQEADKRKEQNAKMYLEKHGLTSFMQFLIQSLMKDKPDDPYLFLQRQITKRLMVSGASDSLSISEQDAKLDALLSKMSTEAGEAVPAEELLQLEKQAAEASEQLKKDNVELKATVDKLKERYKSLMAENTMLQHEVGEGTDGEGGTTVPSPPKATGLENSVFGGLAEMQDEVTHLAMENASLVNELSRMREAVDSVRGEINELSAKA